MLAKIPTVGLTSIPEPPAQVFKLTPSGDAGGRREGPDQTPLPSAIDTTAPVTAADFGILAEQAPTELASFAPVGLGVGTAFEHSNRARLKLLVRKYVAKSFSTEEDARLALESERVSRLLPRVSKQEVRLVTAMAETTRETTAWLDRAERDL